MLEANSIMKFNKNNNSLSEIFNCAHISIIPKISVINIKHQSNTQNSFIQSNDDSDVSSKTSKLG